MIDFASFSVIDHCRAHPTGLAAGYMAAYLHYKLTDGESV